MINVALVYSETPEQTYPKQCNIPEKRYWIWNVCSTVGHSVLLAFITGVPLL